MVISLTISTGDPGQRCLSRLFGTTRTSQRTLYARSQRHQQALRHWVLSNQSDAGWQAPQGEHRGSWTSRIHRGRTQDLLCTAVLTGVRLKSEMIRKALLMKIKPGCREEYERRHNPIWPELQAVLKEHRVSNYSIFLDRRTDQLFGYAEIESDSRWM